MGVIKRGILGGFSNKVGNIVGSTWKGIAVIKSLPLSVANPRTAGQILQRGKFSQLTILGSLLLSSIIKPLWDRFATNMSGYNAFISANRNAFMSNGEMDISKLVLSRGRMLAPQALLPSANGNAVTVQVTNPVNDRFALPTDRLYIAVIDTGSRDVGLASITATQRGTGSTVTVTGTLKANFDNKSDMGFFVGYMRADGSEVSESKVSI